MFKFLTNLDIYGRAIGVHYGGEDAYKTRLGAFMTIVTYVLCLINSYNLLVQFVSKSAQKEGYSSIKVDSLDIESQKLKEKDFGDACL